MINKQLMNLLNSYLKLNEEKKIHDKDEANLVNQKKIIISNSLNALSFVMNDIHGLKKNNYYWSMILNSWVEWFVAIYLNRIKFIQFLKETNNYENIKKNILIKNVLIPFDWNEFMLKTNNINWNIQILSQIINHENFNELDKIKFEYLNKPKIYNRKETIKSKIKKYILNLLIIRKNFFLLTYPFRTSIYDALKLYFKSMGKIYPQLNTLTSEISTNQIYKVQINIDKRKKILKKLLGSKLINKDLCLLLSLNLPISYIENFPIFYQKVLNSRLYIHKPKKIFTSSSHHEDICAQILLAELKLFGSRIITMQHGGANYGTIKLDHNNGNSSDYLYKDHFLTWGWKINTHDKPFPSFRLYQSYKLFKKNKHTIENNNFNVLFICGANKKWEFRRTFHYKDNFLKKNLNLRRKFFNSLSVDLKSKITLRPYNFHYKAYDGLEDIEFIKLNYANINISKVKNIYDLVLNYNLLIFDSLSTFNIEIMTINKPFLLFFDLETYNMSTIGRELFKKLKINEIYHSDEKSLLSTLIKINEVGINIWWSKKNRKKIIDDYKKQFGLFDKNILNSFINLTNKL